MMEEAKAKMEELSQVIEEAKTKMEELTQVIEKAKAKMSETTTKAENKSNETTKIGYAATEENERELLKPKPMNIYQKILPKK